MMRGGALALLVSSPAVADVDLMAPCVTAHTDMDSLTASIIADGWTEVTDGTAYIEALYAENELAYMFRRLPSSRLTAQEADDFLRQAHQGAERNIGFVQVYTFGDFSLTITGPEVTGGPMFRCAITAQTFPDWDTLFASAQPSLADPAIITFYRYASIETDYRPDPESWPVTIDLLEMTYPEGTTQPIYAPFAMVTVSTLMSEEN